MVELGHQEALNYEGSIPVVAVTIAMSFDNFFSKILLWI